LRPAQVDAYVYVAYRDDRVNATAGFADGDSLGESENARVFDPALEIMNVAEGDASPFLFNAMFSRPPWVDDAALRAAGATDVAAAAQGTWVVGQSRQRATLAAKLNLAAFPYDSQVPGIIVESSNWDSNELKWVPTKGAADGIVPEGDKSEVVGGWIVTGSSASEADYFYKSFDQHFSRLSMEVRIDRQSFYYTSRFVFGVAVLVVMAILVLFMVGEEPDRLGFVQSSFLGVISFEFILVLILPPLGYNTRIDNFMGLSFGIIFIIYVYNAFRIGYFKTIEKLSGRDGDEGEGEKGADAGAASGTVNPMHAAKHAGSEKGGEEEPARPLENNLRKVFTVKRISCCWAGSWENLNPHRKLDVLFGSMVGFMYVVASCIVLLVGTPGEKSGPK